MPKDGLITMGWHYQILESEIIGNAELLLGVVEVLILDVTKFVTSQTGQVCLAVEQLAAAQS